MNQHRDSTKKNYYLVWKLFNEFFIKLDEKPRSWEDRLTLFVGYLISNNKQSATVKSYISAVKAVLLMNNIRISEDKFLLSSLVRACRLCNDVVHTRLPIKRGMLAILLDVVQEHFGTQPFLALLYRTLFSMTYYGLFRVSEVTSRAHPVMARDVQVATNKKKILFILCSSKTHTPGVSPQMIKITATRKETNVEQTAVQSFKRKLTLPCLYELLHQYTFA